VNRMVMVGGNGGLVKKVVDTRSSGHGSHVVINTGEGEQTTNNNGRCGLCKRLLKDTRSYI
jgi:hypothetical protein